MKKRLLSVVLIFAIALSCVCVGNYYVKNNDFISQYSQLITKYDQTLTNEEKEQPFGCKRLIVSDYDGNNYGAVDVAADEENDFAVLQFASALEAELACDEMTNDGLTVDADGLVYLDETDKGQICSWASDMIASPQYISNYNMAYDDVIVAVIDTGVMLEHPYIKDRLYSNGYDLSGDGNPNADYGGYVNSASAHATRVCGIIANNTPDNVKILPYKVVQYGQTNCYSSAVVSAINDAVSKGADVINICISGHIGANGYKTAIANATKQGVCVCVSAGNSSEDISNTFPASTPEAITVSALDSNKNFADYSNFGAEVDFVAPGTNINSCSMDSNNKAGYSTASGTSFSTPYITVAFANIKSIDVTLTKDEIYDTLCTFCEDLGDEGRDEYYGNGLINLGNMVFTDNDTYTYKIPQGTLDILKTVDYTAETQPWSLFAGKLNSVTVSPDVDSIGSYAFYNMSSATFNMAQTYNNIGNYAFYGCSQLDSFMFTTDVESIGICAFGNNGDGFEISGYRNTPAENYALSENIKFNVIGCNHNYTVDIVDPTSTTDGYLIYTCAVCGHTYNDTYVAPNIIYSGACGDNLTYLFDNYGRLKITGTGSMYDYITTPAPWLEFAKDIKRIIIDEFVEDINPLAFYNCTNLVKFESLNDAYTVVDNSLYTADLTQLVSYAGGIISTTYQMPETVQSFNASAFVNAVRINTVLPNSNFTVENNVIYDSNGDIVMFMPAFFQSQLKYSTAVTVKENAMILCSNVNSVVVEHPDVVFEPYSVGFFYNSTMQKRNVTIQGCYQALVEDYATRYGFDYQSLNSGLCGETMFWQYNTSKRALSITGSGAMFNYSSVYELPWSSYLSSVRTITIADDVSALSDYAFYNATALRTLTMPLSVEAPSNDTIWYGCSNITTIKLTYGNGVMDDYATSYSDTSYRYTPWYLSRKVTTSFTLDENVEYIGDYAFRNCLSITQLTLKNCREIGDYAFVACSGLASITNYCPDTIIPDYAVFSYKGGSFSIYPGKIFYALCTSTSRDYCDKLGVTYSPVGCKHYVKSTVLNMAGKGIADANVYFDDVLVAVTNKKGEFIVPETLCGEHNYKVECNGVVLSQGVVTVDKQNLCSNIVVAMGDYYADGIINTKDYAVASKHGYKTDNIDMLQSFEPFVAQFNTYETQLTPCTVNVSVTKKENSNTCIFFAEKMFDCEFTVVECGFIFGKNMTDDYLTLDMVNSKNEQGFMVKKAVGEIYNIGTTLAYGSTNGTGKVSARFYAIYTNGVGEYVYYSDVCSYVYN